MKIDSSFTSSYSVEIVQELNSENRYYYPGGSPYKGQDGLIVEVCPSECASWIGVFSFGRMALKGISGIYSMPDPDKLCVVSRGAGYIVSSCDPEVWEHVKAVPVMDARTVVSHNIIVFADYTELIAYNRDGIKWCTDRLSYDGFRIVDVSDSSIKGEYWDIRNEKNEYFEVSLQTGSKKGGFEGL